MDFQPVERSAVSDAVYARLRDAILAGALPAGSTLPGERRLSEQFGVARHGLREAIRRLEQSGLVAVSHGGATRVLDWRTHAGLEVLTELASAGELPSAEVLRSVLEMRLAIGVDAARLAARRAGPAEAAELVAFVAGTRDEAARGSGFAVLATRYERFWRLLLLASDNLAYQLAFNSLMRALASDPALARSLGESEVHDTAVQHELAGAVARGDEDAAAAAAQDLTSRMVVALRAADAS
jgi:GntR family transcriptional regulator, transcriptional repressor for pyruvate dehydrogenase complex